MNRWWFGLCAVLIVSVAVSARQDSTDTEIGFISTDAAPASPDTARTFNPVIALSASILPGGGQLYSRRYVKAGLFAAASASLALYGLNRYDAQTRYRARYEELSDSMAVFRDSIIIDTPRVRIERDTAGGYDTVPVLDTTYFRASYGIRADLAWNNKDETRRTYYQTLVWSAGLYIFNLLDALEGSGVFRTAQPRNPSLAGWLSAVPGLGLGQVYNGAISKAGMIWMTQASLGYMAYNKHTLMRNAEKRLIELRDSTSEKNAYLSEYEQDWDARRAESFRRRNSYLWYSLMFYFYAIFDAVVDAHLHDYSKRMRLEPDLVPRRRGMVFSLNFVVR